MTCLQAVFADAFTVEEVQALARVLYARAMEGNLTAAKMILPYILGKPGALLRAPEPETAELTPQPAEPAPPTLKREQAPVVATSFPACPAADGKVGSPPPRVPEKSDPCNPTLLLDRRADADSRAAHVCTAEGEPSRVSARSIETLQSP